MYQAEDTEGFDSCLNATRGSCAKTISHTILSATTSRASSSSGVAKTFTHLLKKTNNQVVALDFPKLRFAKQGHSFPDIDFRCGDMGEVARMARAGEKFDLALVMGTFAYVESCQSSLRLRRGMCRWLYVADTFLQDPIGFVKIAQSAHHRGRKALWSSERRCCWMRSIACCSRK